MPPLMTAPHPAGTLRRCSGCRQWLPQTREHFYPLYTNRAGVPILMAHCHACNRARSQQYEQQHPGANAVRMRRYRARLRARLHAGAA